jgi:hypothetical protein
MSTELADSYRQAGWQPSPICSVVFVLASAGTNTPGLLQLESKQSRHQTLLWQSSASHPRPGG